MNNDQFPYLELSKLSCEDVEVLIDCYVDGEMLPGLKERFDVHLAECDQCSCLVSDCKYIVSLARTLGDTPVPPEVSSRLRQTLREQVGFLSKPKLNVVKG